MSKSNRDNKMAVTFDAGPMIDNSKTGVGYFVANTINALSRVYSSNLQLEGFYFNFLKRHKVPPTLARNISYDGIHFFPSKLLSICRRLGFQPNLRSLLLAGYHKHILFTNYIALPVSPKTHVTLFIYDLGFMDCPEYLQEVNLKVLKRFCPPSIQRAQTIITISEFTKQRILHHFPDTQAEIIVTPIPPIKMKGARRPLDTHLKEIGVVEKKYIFYLGTLEPRKNIVQLVRAYSLLPQKVHSEYSLVLAGGKGWKDSEINKEISLLKSKGFSIIQTGYISDDEKDALYTHAACFVLASHYEGFGMPILEAMSYDIPIALSDIPVFREVAKDAALYFNKDNSVDIAQKISSLLGDSAIRNRFIKNGRLVLANLKTWDDNAKKIMDTLK
jgi:O-antigen biosynthesis alpha-1,3-rhamnosyltransferase